jgi:MFS family permease
VGKLTHSLETFGQVVRRPQIRRLEASWALAMVSGWAYSVAVVVYTYDKGGADLVGLAVAIKIAPAAIAAPLIAAVADRVSRRLVLAGAQVGLAAVAALVGLAIATGAPVGVVIALGAVLTVINTALQPAVSALLPELCTEPDELTAANVVNSSIESLAIFVGPAIGGIVIGVSDPQTLAFVTAAGFVSASLFAIRIRETRPPEPSMEASEAPVSSLLADVSEGFRIVRADPSLRGIIGLMVCQTFVDGALSVLVPVAAFELLRTGEAGIGFLNSACGVGALLGSVIAAGMVGGRLAPPFAFGLALWGLPLALLPLLPHEAAALVLFGVIGVGNILIDVAGLTMLQRAAPEEVLARVFGVLEAMILTSIALGGLLTPVLLSAIGTDATFVVVGWFLPVLAVLSWPRLRRIDANATAPSEALELLRPVPLFAPLGARVLEDLARGSRRVSAVAGETVFEQGEVGDRFYVIVSGEARVLVDGIEARVEEAGDHFGEIALLRDTPRTATVVAKTDLDLLSVEGPDFVAAVSGHGASRDEADAVIGARLAHMRPSLGTL